MNFGYGCFPFILLMLCFTMTAFANKKKKPKTPQEQINCIVKETHSTVKATNKGGSPCYGSFSDSLKVYSDARTVQLQACATDEKCAGEAVAGMKSDAKLAIESAGKCSDRCSGNSCKETLTMKH